MKILLRFLSPIALVLALAACEEPIRAPENYQQLRKQEPITVSHDVTYFYTDSGVVRAKLTAPQVKEFLDTLDNKRTYTVIDQPFKILFYNSLGQEESVLTADRATLDRVAGFAEVSGHVVLVNLQSNERMETEKVRWLRGQKLITTNKYVKISTKNEVLYGDSLVANTDFTWYKLFKIHGTFIVEDK